MPLKRSHVRILNESVAPPMRAHRFSALHYSVCKFEPGDLPLGDSVVLFHVKGERSFKPFMDKGDELVHLVLPLASDKYLLGATDRSPPLSSESLPLEIARCSMEYYICARQNDRAADLRGQIGRNSGWLLEREMSTLLDDVLSGLMEKKLT